MHHPSWKGFIIFCAILLLLLPLSGAVGEDDGNLLDNGNFTVIDSDGIPEGWYTEAYIEDIGYSVFRADPDVTWKGNPSVSIQNVALNDARYAQVVSVNPETYYCLSGDIMTEGVEEGHGANLSIEGVYAFSEEIFDTGGEWQYVEWYGKTGPDQEDVTIFVRLGGYSGESLGKAWFSNIRLEEVSELPEGVTVAQWYKEEREPAYYEDEEDLSDTEETLAWPWLLVLGIAYTGLLVLFIRGTRDGRQLPGVSKGGERLLALAVFAVALVIRIILSANVQGYDVDVNCFVSWGNTMATHGPLQFYQNTGFCDYPPAYTYVLGLCSLLTQLLHASEGLTRIIFRFVPSACDVAACWLIFREAKKLCPEKRAYALGVTALMALNPAVILNSAAWGQMDSVLCLLLMMVALYAIRQKWQIALPLYMLSVLVKPQALMLGFLGLAAIIFAWIREPGQRKSILTGLGISLGVFVVIVLPFNIHQDADWLIKLYGSTLSSYPYATLNTANLFYLLGGNWKGIETQAVAAAPLKLAVFAALWGYYRLKTSEAKGALRMLEWSLPMVFAVTFIVTTIVGATWGTVGWISMGFAFVIVITLYVQKGDIRFLPYAGALLFILLYVLGVKMHERYIFPALFLLGCAWAIQRDRRILWLMAALTFPLFLNEGIVLDNSIRLGSSMGHLNNDTLGLACVLSVINIGATVYALWLATRLILEKAPAELGKSAVSFLPVKTVESIRSPLAYQMDDELHWTLRDTVIVCAITLVYSVVSLCTLGSTRAPQNAWTSSGYDESIILDTGEHDSPVSLLYFAQVSRYDFSVAESDDLNSWSEETYAQMDQGQCWRWKYVTESWENEEGKRSYSNSGMEDIIWFNGRYLRISAHQIGLALCEVLVRDKQGEILPVTIVERIGGTPDSELYSDPALILDEQDTLEGLPSWFGYADDASAIAQPSWWNSTYFDEIYHARTGYEFLKGTVPYETTHPPFGKVLISVCIYFFGMTPFGWRFAGALAGILMLPGIYLFAKQLTKKTFCAALACGLMALDCMHLTQTQIATIDSFPVLFIMMAFLFMLRFMQQNILTEKKSRVLTNLGLSGLFMGLAVASKWIGIYAGLGLAVLFFWHCLRHIRLCAEAEKMLKQSKDKTRDQKALEPYLRGKKDKLNPGWRKTIELCAWCLLFFVAIPLAIYLLSYLPYFAYDKSIHGLGDYLSSVWDSQEGMLSYHSNKGLGMDHPFYSPWWEWPIIGKPMYYASEQYLTENSLHYSIFCFGNPVVWYGGLVAVALCFGLQILRKRYATASLETGWHLFSHDFDNRWGILIIGLLAQYLPWMLVPRGTYIYHYFASIPFLILMMSFLTGQVAESQPKWGRILVILLSVLAAVFFVLLFPYASGIFAPASWMDIGKGLLRIWY